MAINLLLKRNWFFTLYNIPFAFLTLNALFEGTYFK